MSDDPQSLKARVARRYGLLAPVFDRIGPRLFTLHGRRLVELAQVASGERVLDVAAGRGAVLFAAAERAGPSGRVAGIDLTPEMVEQTAREIAARGLSNAEIVQMDAENLEFPGASFDCVLCGFGLFFLPHLGRALAECHRVLRLGGRFGATTDGGADERWAWWYEMQREYGVESRVAAQRLEDPGEVPAALEQAGFVDVRVIQGEFDLVYADEAEWWASQHVDLEGAMDPAALAKLKSAAFERVQGLRSADGIHRWSRGRYNLARKPA